MGVLWLSLRRGAGESRYKFDDVLPQTKREKALTSGFTPDAGAYRFKGGKIMKYPEKIKTILSITIVSLFLVNSPCHNAWAKEGPKEKFGSNTFAKIAKRVNPAVVHIGTITKSTNLSYSPEGPFRGSPFGRQGPSGDFFERFFGPRKNMPRRSLGSGFIIDKEGYILTNNHVVEGADEIKVTLKNEEKYEARVVGADPKTDIALIKIDADNDLPVLAFGDSDELRTGEWVMAIGNPFGLNHTVTVGVVSAKSRTIGFGPYDNYIQTDASINPGNSGGPLINTKGEVVGINSAIYAGNAGGNIGIGFAIPINSAKSILEDLKKKGSVTRGRLGVMIQKITPELAKSLNLSQNEGALIGDVEKESPAEKSGIKRGDVIIEFNGQSVKTMKELPWMVSQTKPGVEVEVVVIRDGKKKVLKAILDTLEDMESQASVNMDEIGLRVQDITPNLAKSLKLASTDGVLVSSVASDGPAGRAGIVKGDVIAEMNKEKVYNLKDFQEKMGKTKKDGTILFLIKRERGTIYIVVK